MISKTYPLGSFERYKYVVIMSRMDGGFLLSRHKQRTTWEFQGGHIEPGETPMQAARRELFEESGATSLRFAITGRAVRTGRAARAASSLPWTSTGSALCRRAKWPKPDALSVCRRT